MKQNRTDSVPWSLSQRYGPFWHAGLFVLGFSLIFIVGGGGAGTVFGRLFGECKVWLARAGGLMVILFGLMTLGVIKPRWFYYDTRPQWQANPAHRSLSSLLMGLVFAARLPSFLSPCVLPLVPV